MKTEEVKTMNAQEKAIYKAGYLDGKTDTLDALGAALAYVHDHPDCDPADPATFAEILAAADGRLRAKGSAMTLTQAPAGDTATR